MSRKSTAEKIAKKRADFVSRTAAVLHIGETEATRLLATERRQSLRLNTLKLAPEQALAKLHDAGWRGQQYDWMAAGYTIDTPFAVVRDSEPVVHGEVYIQNAASWLPVLALDPQPGELVLDVCAAPGGKTSHIAALTNNQARIWANDSSKPRLIKMRANLALLGAAVERFTLYDAQHMARKLDGQQFDKILIDAPCSSEGLRNINSDKDMHDWSIAHIKRLQKEQKNIVRQVWQLLKPGGTLVYSTCTMAPEENEAVVDFLLRKHEDARVVPITLQLPNRVPALHTWNNKTFSRQIAGCLRLKPSENIEAFFVCKIQKYHA